MKVYKIRNKETGQFSIGGTSSYKIWTKGGKTWSNIGHVKNHLHAFLQYGTPTKSYPYQNAEIVEIEIKEEECLKYDVDTLFNKMAKEQTELWDSL